MAGRRPKPTILKIRQGNPGRRPIPKGEPQPRQGVPKCPAWLSRPAKSEWRRIVPELKALGLLTHVDMAALSGYCQAFAEFQIATRILDVEGRVVDVPVMAKGEQIGTLKKRHPACNLQLVAFARMKSYLIEFGFSPASRPKLAGAGDSRPAAPDDPLQALIDRANAKKKT